MSSNIYSSGLRNVGSYQVAGHPYISGSNSHNSIGSIQNGIFNFPYVTKKVIVKNNDLTGKKLLVSFVPFLDGQRTSFDLNFANFASGSGNWLLVPGNSSIELDVKCKQIFVSPASADAISTTVFAELTNIPTGSMYSFDGLEGISI